MHRFLKRIYRPISAVNANTLIGLPQVLVYSKLSFFGYHCHFRLSLPVIVRFYCAAWNADAV